MPGLQRFQLAPVNSMAYPYRTAAPPSEKFPTRCLPSGDGAVVAPAHRRVVSLRWRRISQQGQCPGQARREPLTATTGLRVAVRDRGRIIPL
jgi:hypothetical protein